MARARIRRPAGRPARGAGLVIPPQPETAVAPSRVGHRTIGRVVASEAARTHAHEHTAGSITRRRLEIAAAFVECPERTGESHAKRAVVLGTPGPDGDDAAHRVGTVSHRRRPAGDLDTLHDCGIDERPVRPGAALARRPAAVDEDRRPPPPESADRRRGRLAFGDEADPRDVLEALAQRGGGPHLEVGTADERHGRAGRRVDRRRGAHDVNRLDEPRFHENPHLAAAIRGLETHGARDSSVGQDHCDHNREGNRNGPFEAAIDARADGATLTGDRYLGIGNWRLAPRIQHDAGERKRPCRGEQYQQDGDGQARPHAFSVT